MPSGGERSRAQRVGSAGGKAGGHGEGTELPLTLSCGLGGPRGCRGHEGRVSAPDPRPRLAPPAAAPVPCLFPARVPTWARRNLRSSPGAARGPGASAAAGSAFPAPPCSGRARRGRRSGRRRGARRRE